MSESAAGILLAGNQGEIAPLHAELVAEASLGKIRALVMAHFQEVDHVHIFGEGVLHQELALRRILGRVMHMHVPRPPTPRGEVNPPPEQQRAFQFTPVLHLQLLNHRDILHAVAGRDPPTARGQVDEEIARGLINDRLLPVG